MKNLLLVGFAGFTMCALSIGTMAQTKKWTYNGDNGGKDPALTVRYDERTQMATGTPAFAQSPSLWTLNSIVVTSKLNGYETVIRDQHDASGGSVDISVDGRASDFCSGGSEKLRFIWRFTNNAARISNGATISTQLQAGIVSLSKPCYGSIAGISELSLHGSKGSTYTLSEDQARYIDGDRFLDKSRGDNYVRAGGTNFDEDRFLGTPGRIDANAKQVVAAVGPDVGEPLADRPWAYFYLEIHPRSGGSIYYTYVYKQGEGGALAGGGGGVGGGGGGGGSPTGDACGHSLGSGLLNKWNQLGGAKGVLACASSDEAEAGRSPQGTTGRYARFSGSGGGVIIWHRDGALAGRAFEVHGCIGGLYQSMGGTGSWLGFPISDEHDVQGGRRSDFQGGYIFWDARTSRCQAYQN